jgi:glutamate synthase (NADPH/NADH) small chain
VQVREIEKQIVDRAFDEGWIAPQPAPESTGKRVAIVGSGPAGLAAAQQLARAGHGVTVFEREDRVGGLLRYGIPEPRLAKRLIDRRVEQLSAEGVTFRTGVEVGRDVSASTLPEGFDAILLTLGAPRPRDLSVPGRSRRGVVFAMDFLRGSASGDGEGTYVAGDEESPGGATRPKRWASVDVRGRTVTVIGGGLTGADCVEAALTRGAREVHQLEILPASRRPAGTGPGVDPTTDLDGVDRKWCVATKAFAGQGDTLTDVRAVRVKWVPSPTGPVMREQDDTEFEVKTDVAVLALGFEPVPDRTLVGQLELETDEHGKLLLRDHQTSREGIFAAGDLATGAAYVATAIASGRNAAERIDRFLRQRTDRSVLG